MTINVTSNVDSVIDDIGDLKTGIAVELGKNLKNAMNLVAMKVRTYINDDPHYTGKLLESVEPKSNDAALEYEVRAGGSEAPYAAIVEYGSGARTNISYDDAPQMPYVEDPPRDYPFDPPDIDNISGFAFYIEQWMREKGIEPELETYSASASAIAKVIVERGNYAHPFMRPAWRDEKRRVERAAKRAVEEAVDNVETNIRYGR
jgi:HK97 gp10 family phage protein